MLCANKSDFFIPNQPAMSALSKSVCREFSLSVPENPSKSEAPIRPRGLVEGVGRLSVMLLGETDIKLVGEPYA